MTAYPRAELDEMVERWLQANRDAEEAGDGSSDEEGGEVFSPDEAPLLMRTLLTFGKAEIGKEG